MSPIRADQREKGENRWRGRGKGDGLEGLGGGGLEFW